jgi:hypothetical protein
MQEIWLNHFTADAAVHIPDVTSGSSIHNGGLIQSLAQTPVFPVASHSRFVSTKR